MECGVQCCRGFNVNGPTSMEAVHRLEGCNIGVVAVSFTTSSYYEVYLVEKSSPVRSGSRVWHVMYFYRDFATRPTSNWHVVLFYIVGCQVSPSIASIAWFATKAKCGTGVGAWSASSFVCFPKVKVDSLL